MKRPAWLSARALTHLLIFRPALRLIFGVNIRGRENLDGLDRFIIISNHNSHLDTLLLFATLPAAQIARTHPVAAKDYFSKSRVLFALVQFLFRPVWVDREGAVGQALPEIQALLDGGENIILFPEGTRGEPGELAPFRKGIGKIASTNPQIPVLPIFLEGPERSLPRKVPFPLPMWNHVTVAPPQRLRGRAEDITRSLQASLESLEAVAKAARSSRPEKRATIQITAVLGIDGSGKSTLSRMLAEGYSRNDSACLISDELLLYQDGLPRDFQPLMIEKLRRWVSTQAKQAGSLARYKIPKLAELLLRDRLLAEARRWYRPRCIFMDGMPLLNLTAWAILYKEEAFNEEVVAKVLNLLSGKVELPKDDLIFQQFSELSALRKLHLDHMALPDRVIFSDVPAAVCVERIASRGEERQVHETEEKLSRLREGYLLLCRVLERDFNMPVLILDGNRPLDTVFAEAKAFVKDDNEPFDN
ncbi:1-acyl-sn-glycerol-3-phosphate acyltransferase [bacterium]|nr:1-acyl-sn-glycerol-3-phosphate acyltransferase [bacterium]